MSELTASISTTLPLPSSPHCEPKTIVGLCIIEPYLLQGHSWRSTVTSACPEHAGEAINLMQTADLKIMLKQTLKMYKKSKYCARTFSNWLSKRAIHPIPIQREFITLNNQRKPKRFFSNSVKNCPVYIYFSRKISPSNCHGTL